MFWSMTATRFGSYGLAETVGSVPALTLTADRTCGVGVEKAVGLAFGEGVASIVGSAVGLAVGEGVAVVAVAAGGEAEAGPCPPTAGREPAAARSPSVARATHVAPPTATMTHERRLRDTLDRPRGSSTASSPSGWPAWAGQVAFHRINRSGHRRIVCKSNAR
jgi:hypothetical protein